jgi:hypothetical protein
LRNGWEYSDNICKVDKEHSQTLGASNILHNHTAIHDESVNAYQLVHRSEYNRHYSSPSLGVPANACRLSTVRSRVLGWLVCFNLCNSSFNLIRVNFGHELAEFTFFLSLLKFVRGVVFEDSTHQNHLGCGHKDRESPHEPTVKVMRVQNSIIVVKQGKH